MQIIKTCNKHGVLSPENINLRLRRNSNPNHNPIWYEKTCGLCKKDKDKTEYNNLPRFNERKKLTHLLCTACKKDLPIWEFTNSGLKRKYPDCKHCHAASARETYRKSYLKNRYNINQEIYDNLLSKQNNLCAICCKPETRINGSTKKVHGLNVDHDHKTGIVRGLLCHLCNTAIGKLMDSPMLLRKAAEYLEKNANT